MESFRDTLKILEDEGRREGGGGEGEGKGEARGDLLECAGARLEPGEAQSGAWLSPRESCQARSGAHEEEPLG